MLFIDSVCIQYYCEISPQRKCEIFPQRKQTGEKAPVESEPEGSMSVDCSVAPATIPLAGSMAQH